MTTVLLPVLALALVLVLGLGCFTQEANASEDYQMTLLLDPVEVQCLFQDIPQGYSFRVEFEVCSGWQVRERGDGMRSE